MSQSAALNLDESRGVADPSRAAWTALIQVLVLTGLWIALIRGEYEFLGARMFGDSEAAHALAAPVLIGLLLYRRWDLLVANLRPGSVWGLGLIGFALFMFAIFTWPFFLGFPRQAAIVPAVAGFILTVAGWRVLKLCVPVLVILLLAVPIGWRQYAFLIIWPETQTFKFAEMAFNLLPGVFASFDGPDISYTTSQSSGSIALGDPHRGASLFLAMAMIGAFVTYARIRPLWQFVAIAVCAGPILVICNFLRLIIHGLVTIYGDFDAISSIPRLTAAASALLLAYGMFAAVLWTLNNAVQPAEEKENA